MTWSARFARQVVAFGDDGDHDAVARFHFLHVRDAFFRSASSRRDRIRRAWRCTTTGKIFVDQRVGAVLHFAGGIAFGVDVGNFLELERAFESDGVVDAAAEIEEIGVAEKLPRELFEFRVALQDGFDLVRECA